MSFPIASTPFVGRVEELAHISALFSDPACRLLTLVGPGGIGKTRLALEVAHLLMPPHTASFVPLQPLTSPDHLVSALASALEFPFASGIDPQQQLLDYLRDKAWLLVLDNFEQLLDGAPLLSALLANAPLLRVLVTSRERLYLVEEWVLEVGGLTYPTREGETELYSAVELFVQQARRIKADFRLTDQNRAAIGRICRLVGGMPLGIELAAHWVRVLACDAIADELQHSLDFLETSVRNVEPRHRTLRAAFMPTWDRLTPDERTVFMRLSVFRGGFTREAACHVAGASLRSLSALVDKSLLRVDAEGRYDLHELLRQYGDEQLKVTGQAQAIQQAHSAYYGAFLHQQWYLLRTAQQPCALDAIEVEFENVCLAWQHMVATHDTQLILTSVYSLWLFSDLRGRYREAAQLVEQAEAAFRFAPETNPEAKRVLGLLFAIHGWFAVSFGRLDEAYDLTQAALQILEQVGTDEDRVLAWHSLSLVFVMRDDARALLETAQREVALSQQLPDRWFYTLAIFPLGNANLLLGDLQVAASVAQEFYDLAEVCGDLFLRACSTVMLADIAKLQHEEGKAQQLHEQALKIYKAINNLVMTGHLQRELGIDAFRRKAYSTSAYYYRQSLNTFVHMGEQSLLLRTLIFIAELQAALHQHEQAVELLALALHQPTIRLVKDDQEKASQALHQFQAQLPTKNALAAYEWGRQRVLEAVIQECGTQLDSLIAASSQNVSSATAEAWTAALSHREVEVLQLIAGGCSNQEIADRLFIGVSTVKKHINHIFDKLEVKNRTQAVAYTRQGHLFT